MHAKPSLRPYRHQDEAFDPRKLIVLLALTFMLGVDASSPLGVRRFLDWFWQRPLVSQGGSYVIEGEPGHPLAPETCGHCHEEQLEDWQESRHARAMGPGVLGQLPSRSQEQIQECLNCHAPLREQADSLQRTLTEWSESGLAEDPSHSEESLHTHGVLCSACHVRSYRWYGPPRYRDRSAPDPDSIAPHEGWIAETAFEDPRFCAACHQFPQGGYTLNGKLLENTYQEWKASPQAPRGLTCQRCHMPARRHLWRGIHDPEAVRSGVSIEVSAASVAGGVLRARLSLTNSGIGHFFPTYVTPHVVLEVYQEGADGGMIDGTGQRLVIARDVSLDLSTEYSDTRLPPGQTAVLNYVRPRSPDAIVLAMKVQVEPDAFYSGFFQTLLESNLGEESRMLIAQALAESNGSAFAIFEKRYEIAAKAAENKKKGP
jgi:hypothetical protein